jgi:hypothetical protein
VQLLKDQRTHLADHAAPAAEREGPLLRHDGRLDPHGAQGLRRDDLAGPAGPVVDLHRHRPAVGKSGDRDPLGPILGDQPRHTLHECGHVAVGATDPHRVRQHGVDHPPAGASRLREHAPVQRPGQPDQAQPEQRRPAAVHPRDRHVLAGESLDGSAHSALQRMPGVQV